MIIGAGTVGIIIEKESEIVSLRYIFDENFKKIEISNTEGMTFYTMDALIEEAIAPKALQFSKMPPVVHHKISDPDQTILFADRYTPTD